MSNQEDYEYVAVPEHQSSEGGSIPVPNRIDRADFVDKIKPEQVLEVLRHKLLGEDWIGTKWEKLPALQEKALSQRGAWEISNLMLSAGSINVSISKLSRDQIAERLRNLINELMIICLMNWKEYGIHDAGQLYYIKSLVFSNALVVLSQAGEGSIQELFKTTVAEHRHVSTTEDKQSKIRRMLGL
ncbi:MAG: hypothetical protein U9Q97_06600 [Acidobacteriota bacterium]|nr:hypothetical protein [Acidobacteriota bacterium]